MCQRDISEDGWAYRTKIFDTLLMKLKSGTSLKVHLFPFSNIKPDIKKIVRVNEVYLEIRYPFYLTNRKRAVCYHSGAI